MADTTYNSWPDKLDLHTYIHIVTRCLHDYFKLFIYTIIWLANIDRLTIIINRRILILHIYWMFTMCKVRPLSDQLPSDEKRKKVKRIERYFYRSTTVLYKQTILHNIEYISIRTLIIKICQLIYSYFS